MNIAHPLSDETFLLVVEDALKLTKNEYQDFLVSIGQYRISDFREPFEYGKLPKRELIITSFEEGDTWRLLQELHKLEVLSPTTVERIEQDGVHLNDDENSVDATEGGNTNAEPTTKTGPKVKKRNQRFRAWFKELPIREKVMIIVAFIGACALIIGAIITGIFLIVSVIIDNEPSPQNAGVELTATQSTPAQTTIPSSTPSPMWTSTNTVTITPSPSPTLTSTPILTLTSTEAEIVVQMVKQYYKFIHAGDGQAAYDLLHPELQSSSGFFPFDEWNATVANVEYEFVDEFPSFVEVRGNQARVDFVINWEQSEELPVTLWHTFCFTYRIADQRWFIRHIYFEYSDCFNLMNP